MMHPDQAYRVLEQGPVAIRALRSLRSDDTETVIHAIAAAGKGWSVQVCDDYDGYRSILVEPKDESAAHPAYLISGTVNWIELAEIRNDELSTVGAFDNVTSAAKALASLLRYHIASASSL
jgi:hypothetical protein